MFARSSHVYLNPESSQLLESIRSFSPEVSEKLGYYVYRLIDPRSGDTFYVGKGRGNRVFAHAEGAIDGDELGEKMLRIRDIRLAGLEVHHVIHRHGMDEATAFTVEAALIDAYPGLTNVVDGSHSGDLGSAHAKEIVTRYQAEEADFDGLRALLINVNKSAADRDLYEATRYAWRISKDRAEQADVVLAVRQGVICGAFVAYQWLEATPENFPGREPVPGRYGFVGQWASQEIQDRFVGARIPDSYRERGAANPIRYV